MESDLANKTTDATDAQRVEESKEELPSHFVMPGKDKNLLKAEDLDQEAIADLEKMIPNLKSITLSGHSYGLEACQHIGNLIKDAPKLKKLNFSNIFIGKLKDEIPVNLDALLVGLRGKDITYVDLSDNAFGPAGVPGFDQFLKTTPAIKVLKMINCGLGPAGSKSLSECLIEGELKLNEFYAGRNRMECTGFTEIAQALKGMGTLKKIEMPQNFVRKGGMGDMIEALKANPDLQHIHLHDNWLKEEAIKEFSLMVKSLKSLKSINISDCDIGGSGVAKIVKAIGDSESSQTIEEFLCNYNDVERSKTTTFIFLTLIGCPNLKTVSFYGHDMIKSKLKQTISTQFENHGKTLIWKDPAVEEDEDEEEDEDDEEEISDEDEEDPDSEEEDTDGTKDLLQKFENLKLE